MFIRPRLSPWVTNLLYWIRPSHWQNQDKNADGRIQQSRCPLDLALLKPEKAADTFLICLADNFKMFLVIGINEGLTQTAVSFWLTKTNGLMSTRMCSAASTLISAYCLMEEQRQGRFPSWFIQWLTAIIKNPGQSLLPNYWPCHFHLKSSFFHGNGIMAAGSSWIYFLFHIY